MSNRREPAFARAAEARAAIDSIVGAVERGELELAGAFARADADPLVGRCFAVKVFEVVPGIGKVRARRTMESLKLADDLWLGDVPAEQRQEVAAAFAGDAEPRGPVG